MDIFRLGYKHAFLFFIVELSIETTLAEHKEAISFSDVSNLKKYR